MPSCPNCRAETESEWVRCPSCGVVLTGDGEQGGEEGPSDTDYVVVDTPGFSDLSAVTRRVVLYGGTIVFCSLFMTYYATSLFGTVGYDDDVMIADGYQMIGPIGTALLLVATGLAVVYWRRDTALVVLLTSVGSLVLLALFLQNPFLGHPFDIDGFVPPSDEEVARKLQPAVGYLFGAVGYLLMAGGSYFKFKHELPDSLLPGSADDDESGPPSYAEWDDPERALVAAVHERLAEGPEAVLTRRDIVAGFYDDHSLGHDDSGAWWRETAALLREAEELESRGGEGERWRLDE